MSGIFGVRLVAIAAFAAFALSACNDSGQKNPAAEPYGRYSAETTPGGSLYVVDQLVGFVYQCDDPNQKFIGRNACRLIGSVNDNYHNDEIEQMFSKKQ